MQIVHDVKHQLQRFTTSDSVDQDHGLLGAAIRVGGARPAQVQEAEPSLQAEALPQAAAAGAVVVGRGRGGVVQTALGAFGPIACNTRPQINARTAGR